MAMLPKRSRKFVVGKEIGGAIYVHREYESILPAEAIEAKKQLPNGTQYTVVKFAFASKATSFIHSADFDSADEPTVGNIVLVSAAGEVRQLKAQRDPFIYHHKWLFVMDDYTGFDVDKSKTRSICWLGLLNLDMKRIGRKSFWTSNVLPRLSEVSGVWLSSTEMARKLRVTSCELSHLRTNGELPYKKIGNAYLYHFQE